MLERRELNVAQVRREDMAVLEQDCLHIGCRLSRVYRFEVTCKTLGNPLDTMYVQGGKK
jgi:hypothetical protein